jgi:hypothetical protein
MCELNTNVSDIASIIYYSASVSQMVAVRVLMSEVTLTAPVRCIGIYQSLCQVLCFVSFFCPQW